MGVRPSELYGIKWPLAAFYFDRAVRNWATFVDNKVEEAEMTVRNQMRNRKGSDSFALQARQVQFNKLVGLDVESAYAPVSVTRGNAEKRSGPRQKPNLDDIVIPGVTDTNGHRVNMTRIR